MERQPGVDRPCWNDVLAHRSSAAREAVADRFAENGIGPELVRRVLQDGGDSLYEAAGSGSAGWADAYGGPLAVALLAAEVSALAAHLNSRGSAVRSAAVAELLDEFSAVTVAERLGVSRQQVYEVRRGEVKNEYISRVPWRVK